MHVKIITMHIMRILNNLEHKENAGVLVHNYRNRCGKLPSVKAIYARKALINN